MASFTITSDTSAAQTLENGQVGFVMPAGSIVTTASAAVSFNHISTNLFSTLNVLGTVAAYYSPAIASVGTMGRASINVGAQGSLTGGASSTAAIALTVGGSDIGISNAGRIFGGKGIELNGAANTQSAVIQNTGTIEGSLFSISATIVTNGTFENLTIRNQGSILAVDGFVRAIFHQATAGTLDVSNAGTISATGAGIETLGTLVLNNQGTVQGGISFALGATIHNTGLLLGAVSDSAASGTQASSIVNSGEISSGVILGSGPDSVLNTGLMGGSVTLGAGSNTLENIDGLIRGSVFGGVNNDTLRNTGEILGSVTLGDGVNLLSNLGGTIIGGVSGGVSNDTLRNTGEISGSASLGDGNNSIENLGGRIGISVITGTGNDTLTNTGTIQRTVLLGDGTNTVENLGGLIGWLVQTGSGNDSVTNSGTIGRNVELGEGSNTLDNLAGGVILGDVITGSGTDRVTNSGLIQRDVELGDGLNVLDNLGGTIGGSVTLGLGNDFVTNSGIIRGNVNLGGGDNSFNGLGGVVLGTVVSSSGNDVFFIDRSNLVIFAGDGLDQVLSSVSYGLSLSSGIEILALTGDLGLRGIGSGADERINGGAGNDTIDGRGGDDRLNGGEGDDLLFGGEGNDLFFFSDGTDTMFGGAGTDTISFQFNAPPILIELGPGRATRTDGAGEVLHSATLRGIENAIGGNGADTIIGSLGANRLDGSVGDDSINAAGGDDTLIGGLGRDTLSGGGGTDLFVYTSIAESAPGAADLITDFVRGFEKIDLSLIDADPLAADDQAFAFIGNTAFSAGAAQVRFTSDTLAGITTIEVRLAGSLVNDMEIVIGTAGNLTAANFLL